jgi:hypothetical protein
VSHAWRGIRHETVKCCNRILWLDHHVGSSWQLQAVAGRLVHGSARLRSRRSSAGHALAHLRPQLDRPLGRIPNASVCIAGACQSARCTLRRSLLPAEARAIEGCRQRVRFWRNRRCLPVQPSCAQLGPHTRLVTCSCHNRLLVIALRDQPVRSITPASRLHIGTPCTRIRVSCLRSNV